MKLAKCIALSWFWVVSPIWGALTLLMLTAAVMVLAFVVFSRQARDEDQFEPPPLDPSAFDGFDDRPWWKRFFS